MKALLAVVAVVEFVVILWLVLAVDAPPPAPQVPERSPEGAEADRVPPPLDPPVPPPPDEPTDGGAATEGTLVYGTLRADDGEAVTTGWITFVDAGARSESVRPDERSLWAKTGVGPGKYVLRVQAEGFEPLEQELDVGEAGPLRVDLVVNRAVLVEIQFVTPEGKPLLAALVPAAKEAGVSLFGISGGLTAIATREPPPPRFPLTLLRTHTRFGTGEYRPNNRGFEPGEGGNGKLTVRGGLPVYISACLRSEVLSTVRLEAPAEKLELVVDPVALLGLRSGVTFLLEMEGEPELPEKIAANLTDRQSGGFNQADVVDGRVTIRNSVPGAMQLTVWGGKEHERYFVNLDLPPGEILDLGTVRLRRTTGQQVLVLDPEGEPVSGARLTVMDTDRSWWEQSEGSHLLSTGPKGTSTLRLGHRRYWVRATSKSGLSGVADLDLTAGARDDFTIRIAGQGDARIEFADTVPTGTQACAEDAAGRPIWGLTVRMPWTYTIKLPPGTYSLIATRPGGREVRTPLLIAIGETAELTIR